MSSGKIYVDATGHVTGTIEDYEGTGFQPTTLTITIRDRATGAIVNGRDADNLTPIGDYVDGSGNVDILLAAADNVLVDAAQEHEIHEVVLKWTYGSGKKGVAVGSYQVQRPGMQ